MLQHGTRVSLSLAMTILFVCVVAAGQFLFAPLFSTYWANRQEISDVTDLLKRYQASLAEEPILLQRLAQRHDSLQNRVVYLEGPTTSLAGAELQDRVRNALKTVGREMKSTETLYDAVTENPDTVKRVGLRVRLSMTTEDLPTVLSDLESGNPYLFLDRLVITKEANKSNGDLKSDDHLDVTFDVFGLLPR
jgi:general secretion pathway protein M